MSKAKIDPKNGKKLAKILSDFETVSSDAGVKMALNKAKAQLNGKRGLRDISGLESLEGYASVISVMLHIHLGNDATDSLKELSKVDSDLADSFSDLVELRKGNASDWNHSRSLTDDDDLSLARRREAWALMPAEAADLSSSEIQKGCLLYTSPSPRDRTRSRMPSSA